MDITVMVKIVENLLKIVLEEIEYCMNILGIILVGWCTDVSRELKKIQKLLQQQISSIITVDC